MAPTTAKERKAKQRARDAAAILELTGYTAAQLLRAIIDGDVKVVLNDAKN